MASFQFPKGSAMFDATSIENMFILEYLPSAPEGFLKPYLYARMLACHPELDGGAQDIARALRMDAETVERAFLYWEQQGLMQKMSDNPPEYQIRPVRLAAADATPAAEAPGHSERLNYIAELQALFGSDDLLHPAEYRYADDWLNVLGMDRDAAVFVVKREKETSKAKKAASVFRKADKTMTSLADRGARSLAEVQRLLEFDGGVRGMAEAVLKRLSIFRSPTEDELKLVRKWAGEWKLTEAEVLAACEKTVKSRNPSLAYLDTVLDGDRRGDAEYFDAVKRVLEQIGSHETPTPEQLRMYAEWRKQGFDAEVVELAAIQVSKRKRSHTFGELEQMLSTWRQEGLFQRADAEEYVQKNSLLRDGVCRLLRRAGSEASPTLADIRMLEAWQAAYPAELIDFAADCARNRKAPMEYMQRLLADWESAGARDVEAARARGEKVRAEKARSAPQNPALNYPQRDYKQEDFGEDFFFDPEKQGYGGEKK